MLFIQNEIDEMGRQDTRNLGVELAFRQLLRHNLYVRDSSIWRSQWWSWAH